MTEESIVVDAIKLQDVNAYREDGNYYSYYADCPYCKTKNDLGNEDKRGYYICGNCSKTFYLR